MSKLKEKLQDLLAETKSKLGLFEQFPDLEEHDDLFLGRRLVSPLAAPMARHYDVTISCKCCSDASIFVHPYYLDADTKKKIYCKAEGYRVGFRYSNGVALDHFGKTMERDKICDTIISDITYISKTWKAKDLEDILGNDYV